MPDGQTLEGFYSGTRTPEKKKTLVEWEKEFAGLSKTEELPKEQLLTEDQARGALQRRALVKKAVQAARLTKRLAQFINSKRKKRPPTNPPNTFYLPEQPVYRVRP